MYVIGTIIISTSISMLCGTAGGLFITIPNI